MYASYHTHIWTDDSADKFQLALCSDEIQRKLVDYSAKCNTCVDYSVDEAAAELSEIILLAAYKFLQRRKNIKSFLKSKHKKWFDLDLKQSRANFLSSSQIYSKYSKG